MNCGARGIVAKRLRSSDTACASALSVTLASGHDGVEQLLLA